jgi:hypothetical protein
MSNDYEQISRAARAIRTNEKSWRRSPTRIIRRGLIRILGAYFIANGLFKGGFTLFLIALIIGDKSWVFQNAGVNIGVAVLVAVLVIIPLAILYRKEKDIELTEFTRAYNRLSREQEQNRSS